MTVAQRAAVQKEQSPGNSGRRFPGKRQKEGESNRLFYIFNAF